MKKHTISVLVENHFGVLARISGLFSARAYNIDSLTVGETEDPNISRMTIIVKGDDKILEQVNKQLNKLIDVIKVKDFKDEEHIERDLMLIKVNITDKNKLEVIQLSEIFRAKVVDVAETSLTMEITGVEEKVNAFIKLMRPYGIKELVRTGIIAISRG